MAYKTKKYYAESVIQGLQNDLPNMDWNIDERDIFVVLDRIVNEQARGGFFENWKMDAPGVSENFITTWESVTVVDQSNKNPSYFAMPVNYADLPMERGIDEIWPVRFQPDGKNHSVVILNHRDVRLYSNNMAGNMDGRLAGYPQGVNFYFTTHDVKKKFGNMGLRLVVRDSSLISATAPYPIPSSKEDFIIKMTIAFFREKRREPTDRVRDKKDQPNL